MKEQEHTMRLSEDPRFIEHVGRKLDDYRRRYNQAAEDLQKKNMHFKRGAWERMADMGLRTPAIFAREYELCIAKKSQIPGTVRMLVNSIGSAALHDFAMELAFENGAEAQETEKKEGKA